MPDLNELLRWSIQNSTLPPTAAAGPADGASPGGEQLSLRWNPASSGVGPNASALHPSDPLYRAAHDDHSPASTPGPATPQAGEPVPLPSASGPGAVPAKRDDLTTEMLDLIMGKSDSVEMKERMDIALDETRDVEARVQALDDFEMLIELIDNANNMAVLKLWEPLLSLLQSPEDDIVAHACWIMGTAVQNNLKAQAALFLYNALPSLLSIINPPTSHPTSRPTPAATPSRSHPPAVRAKATYALSSFLKHWPLASSALSASSDAGYAALRANLAPTAPLVLRRKTAFLVHALTLQAGETYEGEMPNEVRNVIEEHAAAARGEGEGEGRKGKESESESESLVQGLQRTGVYAELANELRRGDQEADVQVQENAMRALAMAASKASKAGAKGLGEDERRAAKDAWARWGQEGQEERGLGGEDGRAISVLLA